MYSILILFYSIFFSLFLRVILFHSLLFSYLFLYVFIYLFTSLFISFSFLFHLFRDYDPLRTGLISESRFHAAISLAKIELSEREFALLVSKYTDDTHATDFSSTHAKSRIDTHTTAPLIRWRDFCDDVEAIFTVKDLQQSPTRRLDPPSISTLRNLSIIDPVYSAKSTELESILREYHALVQQKRIFLKPSFHDFDHHNNGKITLSHFAQALDTVGLPADAQRLQTLFAHYRDMIVPTDVDYLAFLRDVEQETAEEIKEKKEEEEGQSAALRHEMMKTEKKRQAKERALGLWEFYFLFCSLLFIYWLF